MITKNWLNNKKEAQKILENIKFKDLSGLDSQMLFARFLEIWTFGMMVKGSSKKDGLYDSIKLQQSLVAKFRKLDLIQ